jgi:hypothetical protein
MIPQGLRPRDYFILSFRYDCTHLQHSQNGVIRNSASLGFLLLWQMATFDVFSSRETITSWKLEELQNWERLICYGRPGWAAMWKVHANERNNPYSCESLLLLAQSKLMAGIMNYKDVLANSDSTLIQTIDLALLSRRAPLHVGEHSKHARSMVASCMGICMEVSNDLDSLRVEAPSEPVLSEAAARLIDRHELWPRLVRTLLGAMADGAVDSGTVGEITVWILMAMAWDAACISKFTSSSDNITFTRSDVTLGDFLKTLLGEIPKFEIRESSNTATGFVKRDETEANEHFLDNLLKRRICFTHAIQLNNKVASFEDVERGACRMAMLVTHALTAAVDGIIPLFPAEGAEAEELGSVQVQVKNWASFPNAKFKDFFNAMLLVSGFTTKDKAHFMPGLDMVANIGNKEEGRKLCNFYAERQSARACLELSTDANLSLFRNVFETVTKKTDGTDSKVAADTLQSLMSRLVDCGRVQLDKRKSAFLGDMPRTVEKDLLNEIEDLMEVYNKG